MYLEMGKKGWESVVKVEKTQFAPNVKNEYFTTRYLERQQINVKE